ncbi:MAG: hypothetical protein ABIZ80_13570 [Bryobacteraceae bacterium]
MANPPDQGRVWAIPEWISRFTAAVEMMTEMRPDCKAGRAMPSGTGFALFPEEDAPVWQIIPFSLSPGSALVIGAAAETSLYIGHFALAAAGLTEAEPAECHSTYLEIIALAASRLAQAIAAARRSACLRPKCQAVSAGNSRSRAFPTKPHPD